MLLYIYVSWLMQSTQPVPMVAKVTSSPPPGGIVGQSRCVSVRDTSNLSMLAERVLVSSMSGTSLTCCVHAMRVPRAGKASLTPWGKGPVTLYVG